MDTHPHRWRPLFTLQHGVIPTELLSLDGMDISAGSGKPKLLAAGATGWWISGIGWEDTDGTPPYVLDVHGGNRGPEHAQTALAPIVEQKAKHLLKATHDICVTGWRVTTCLPGKPGEYSPELEHRRGTLTVGTVDGQVITFQALSGWTVDTICRRIEGFDTGPGSTEAYTTVTLDDPRELTAARHVTIRIAAIVYVGVAYHATPVSESTYAVMAAAWRDGGTTD